MKKIDFDGPYDKAMKQVEDLAYYATRPDEAKDRLLPKGKPKASPHEDAPKPEESEDDLGEEVPYATDWTYI